MWEFCRAQNAKQLLPANDVFLVDRLEVLGEAGAGLAAVDHDGGRPDAARKGRLRRDVAEKRSVGVIAVAEARNGDTVRTSEDELADILHLAFAVRYRIDKLCSQASAVLRNANTAEALARKTERLRRVPHVKLGARRDDVVLDARRFQRLQHLDRKGEVPLAVDGGVFVAAERIQLRGPYARIDLGVVRPAEPEADLAKPRIVLLVLRPSAILRIDGREPCLDRALDESLEDLLAVLGQAFGDVALDDRAVKVPERHRHRLGIRRLHLGDALQDARDDVIGVVRRRRKNKGAKAKSQDRYNM